MWQVGVTSKRKCEMQASNFVKRLSKHSNLLSIRHPEQGRLYSGSHEEYQDAYSLVRKCHKQHYEALVRLKPYLSQAKQQELEKAWEQYCCFKSDPSQR